jgi:predicted NBD/HSP70 family sugar kinase
VGSSLILPGWAGVSPRRELSRRLGVHVEVDNDANLGALAEVSFGAGRGLSDVIYLRLGSGLGAGLVIGGRLYRGAAGLAGEFGHVQARPEGEICRCGRRGCLETVVAAGALAAQLRGAYGRDLTAREIVELVAAGDAVATGVVAEAGRTIGRGLADICNALNPQAIIVGGEIGEVGEPLLGGIREVVDGHALPGVARAVEVKHAELGEHAEVLGALMLVIGNTERLRSAGLTSFVQTRPVRAGSRQ